MDERKYLKIVGELSRLIGYAIGVLSGMPGMENNLIQKDVCEKTCKYLEEKLILVLNELNEDNKE